MQPAQQRCRYGAVPLQSAAGFECAAAPTWPEGAKGRQPTPGAPWSPWRPASYEQSLRRSTASAVIARRYCMDGRQPRPGALCAPLKW